MTTLFIKEVFFRTDIPVHVFILYILRTGSVCFFVFYLFCNILSAVLCKVL